MALFSGTASKNWDGYGWADHRKGAGTAGVIDGEVDGASRDG